MKARLNPLRSERVETYRYRLDEKGWDLVISRLAAQEYRGLVVGPHGTGKTVFIEDLKLRLERDKGVRCATVTLQDGFFRRDRDRVLEACRALRPGELFFLDGAEWLSPLMRWRLPGLVPRGCGWVCTGHRRGLGLPVLWETRPDPAVAMDLVETLIERSLSAGERDLIECRFRAVNGNIREVLRAVYDELAVSPCCEGCGKKNLLKRNDKRR